MSDKGTIEWIPIEHAPVGKRILIFCRQNAGSYTGAFNDDEHKEHEINADFAAATHFAYLNNPRKIDK